MPKLRLTNLQIRPVLPGRDRDGNYTSRAPVSDAVHFVYEIEDEHDKPICAPCGRYDKFNYVEHPDERATRERLQAALPAYTVRGASYTGKSCRFEAVQAIALPFYPTTVEVETESDANV